ncbi:MAG: DUF421 domain-containing protein [Dehalococcoidia bacterium]
MNWTDMFGTNWQELVELFIRGTLVYLAIFAVLRIVRREVGGISTPDVLVIVVIADAAQNGLAGGYESVPAGVFLVVVIVSWSLAIDFAVFRFPWFARIVEPHPVVLVENGRLRRHNLRKNLITHDELMGAVRSAGIDDLALVRRAYIEGDGAITVVPAKSA